MGKSEVRAFQADGTVCAKTRRYYRAAIFMEPRRSQVD